MEDILKQEKSLIINVMKCIMYYLEQELFTTKQEITILPKEIVFFFQKENDIEQKVMTWK